MDQFMSNFALEVIVPCRRVTGTPAPFRRFNAGSPSSASQALRVFANDSFLIAQFTAGHKPLVAVGNVPKAVIQISEKRSFNVD